MSDYPALQDLMPLLPELVLACGAMLMLMVGVSVGERSAAIDQWLVCHRAAGGRRRSRSGFHLVRTRCLAEVSWSTSMRDF